jgi:hypothetical protein
MLGLIMELRQSWIEKVVVRTPMYPEGRKVHVVLQAVSCDRPAAVLVAGGPHQSNEESFCLSCEAKKSELMNRSE